jgi:hypothetical protein
MLLAVTTISLLLGFILGRVWEIRKHLLLPEPIDEHSRPVEVRVPAGVSYRPPESDSERLAALDREMQALIKTVAIRRPRPNAAAGETGQSAGSKHSPIVLERIWPRTVTRACVDQTFHASWDEPLR